MLLTTVITTTVSTRRWRASCWRMSAAPSPGSRTSRTFAGTLARAIQSYNFSSCFWSSRDPDKSKKAFEIYQSNRRNQNDICPNSCLFTNMYFGPPVAGPNEPDRAHVAWAVFYFRRDIKTTKEYYLYSLLSMAAEIGGYVGLLLGASLVNIGRINSFLLDWCFLKEEIAIDKNLEKGSWETKVTAIYNPDIEKETSSGKTTKVFFR